MRSTRAAEAVAELGSFGQLNSVTRHRMSLRSKRILFFVAALTFVAISYCGLVGIPLIPSSAYTVAVVYDGHSISTRLYRPLVASGLYYIRLPESVPAHYRWIGVAFDRQSAFIPVAIYHSSLGWSYVHADQTHGVRLTDGKVDDSWTVCFDQSDGASFRNPSFDITMSQSR